MCLAIPGKVISINGDRATVDYGGTVTEANISLVRPAVGEYVIVHAGFAIEKLDVREAERSLREWRKFFLGS
jgi:hydrogenase expression/formation protein HypC